MSQLNAARGLDDYPAIKPIRLFVLKIVVGFLPSQETVGGGLVLARALKVVGALS